MNEPREGSLGNLLQPAGGYRTGTVLNGTYRLESVLGSGGMGTVYLAKHVHLGTEVAIKSLVRQYASNDEAMRRFQREAQISSQLGHPNIVHVSDFNYDADGTPFMVMDLLRGETLRARIQARGRIPLEEALPMFRQLCEGLAAAHARGVVHRDLKPENIFLCTPDDQVKILDFGVSKIRDTRTQLTRPMTMLGTPYYMSPEQATGNSGDADALSDVWAVGAIAFETLTGRAPFSADNPVAVFYKIVNEPLPSASEWAPLPQGVDRVIARACEKAPASRYQSTLGFYSDLAQTLVGDDATRQVQVDVPLPSAPPTERPAISAAPADETRMITPPPAGATGSARRAFLVPEEPATRILKQKTPEPATRILKQKTPEPATRILKQKTPNPAARPEAPPGPPSATTPLGHAGASLGDDLTDDPTSVRGGQPTPRPGRTATPAHGRRPFIDEPTRRTSNPAGDPTALVPLPGVRDDAPLEAPRLSGNSRTATPIAAGEQGPAPAAPRRSPWRLVAIGAGVFLAVGAATGTMALRQRRAEEHAMRQEVERLMGERRWGEAQERLTALGAAEGAATPGELAALEAQITSGREAEAHLGKASKLRGSGDLDGALAELDHVAPSAPYQDESRRERSAIVHAFETELARALDDHRCPDAQSIAGKLQMLDHRPPSQAAAECHEDPAPRHHSSSEHGEHAERAERARELSEPMIAVTDPPLGEGGTLARETMQKMLKTAEPFAHGCFAKAPAYVGTMKLRVTAFPGTDHFVATAISTGPIEIRACLEGMLKNVRPPKVTAAVSAERIYSGDGSSIE